MNTEDQYARLPLYLQQAARRNLRAADRSISNFNTQAQGLTTHAPNSVQTPIPGPIPNPTPITTAPVGLALGGALDTTLGGPLPQVPIPQITTAAARATPALPTQQDNYSGHVINPQPVNALGNGAYKTNPAAYNQASILSDQEVARRQHLRKHYGYNSE